MKLGFFLQGPHFIPMAQTMLASFRRAMPDVAIAQLTDGKCPGIVDEVIRIPEELPMGIRRVTHYTRLEGDWCFCGVDVLFRKDVREVFNDPFDVALASRAGTYMERTRYAVMQPFNFDILFSRSPKFWMDALECMKTMTPEFQDNGAEQLVTCALASSPRYNVKIISSAYNFTPKHETEDVAHVSILHMKGRRKAWIPAYSDAIHAGESRVKEGVIPPEMKTAPTNGQVVMS